MGIAYNTSIVRDGLVLYLDAANVKSYPGSGTAWNDLSGNNENYTFGSNLSYSNGIFNLSDTAGAGGGALNSNTLTTSSSCTLVMWIKTTDTQALFWGATPTSYGGNYYVGAFRVGNKEYYGTCGSPDYYQDLEQKPNIYDYIRDGNWHMVEFKNVDFSTWTNQHNFNSYNTFTFDNGSVASIMLYNKILTAEESIKNFEAMRGRFGI